LMFVVTVSIGVKYTAQLIVLMDTNNNKK